MEKIWRKAFFWFLALAFMAIAPTIVMHARGYRFDLSRGVFVFSGSISLKTNPQNISVKLNDEINESKKLNMINSSYNISGLLPDDYFIEISAPEFYPWSKKIDVHSGLASEFWNVLLVRRDYEKIKSQASNADKFYISPKNRYIAYAKQNGNDLALGIYDIEKDAVEKQYAIRTANLSAPEIKENIEWSPDESYLSIPIKKNETGSDSESPYDYSIISRENGLISSLMELSQKTSLSDARWDPLEKGCVFFLSEKNLYRFNILKKEINLISGEVSSYDISRIAVYYAKANNMIFKNILEGGPNPIQVTNSFPGPENAIISKITVYDDSRISLITKENRELYVFNKSEHEEYYRKLSKNIRGAHFSNDGKKLLFWDDYEIFAYFSRDWEVQPIRMENETQSVTRYSEPIDNVQWFKDYEHVIFNSGRWVKIIELDPRDRKNCFDILNTQIGNPMVIYSGAQEKLFFSDEIGGVSNIYSIVFPEPVPLLGIGGA